MEEKVVVAHEAKVFYSMIAMFKCGLDSADYLITTPEKSISPFVKDKLLAMKGYFNKMLSGMAKKLPDNDGELWLQQWERDYQTAASIFNYWGEMDDDKRAVLEEFAKQLHEGNVDAVDDWSYIDKHGLPDANRTLYIVFKGTKEMHKGRMDTFNTFHRDDNEILYNKGLVLCWQYEYIPNLPK